MAREVKSVTGMKGAGMRKRSGGDVGRIPVTLGFCFLIPNRKGYGETRRPTHPVHHIRLPLTTLLTPQATSKPS